MEQMIQSEPEQTNKEPLDSFFDRLRQQIRVIPDAQAQSEEQRRTARRMEAKAVHLRCTWGAPPRHAMAEVDRSGVWGQKLALIEAEIGKGCMWALTGTRGNGKTQLAVEAMRTATARGLSARYTSAIRLFAEIKSTYRKDAVETEVEVLDRYRKVKLLVIDEIGKRGETEWESNLLFELLNNRYGDMTDTILIANLALTELAASLGPSLSGRLNETGAVIHCDWAGRR